MIPYMRALFILEVFLIHNFMPCILATDFQSRKVYTDVNSSILKQFFGLESTTLQNSTQNGLGSNSDSTLTELKVTHSKNDDNPEPSIVDGMTSSADRTSALINDSTQTADDNLPYSVTSPFGVDGRPLLLDTTTHVRGYKAVPNGNSMGLSRAQSFDSTARRGQVEVGMVESYSPWGTQWARDHDWTNRPMAGQNTRRGMTRDMSQNSEINRQTEQNREITTAILTKALDILIMQSSEQESGYNRNGEISTCNHSNIVGSKSGNEKRGNKLDLCPIGSNRCRNKKFLNYSNVFGQWLRKSRVSEKHSALNGKKGLKSTSPPRMDIHSNLPPPRTRTAFRSVQASTSSLAKLLDPDRSASGHSSNSGGDGSNGNTGGSASNDAGRGGAASPNGGDGGAVSSVSGVDKTVFNKFAMETVTFEKQSASEFQRLDNLLRQLAMAAQTDFASVSSSVNALQQELVQTQQQLVQAWSILNTTHVKDNTQTMGDLRGVKTDVYRLHALLTGATPLGQATAQGRAAEVKEVAAVGPGVDCAAIARSGVNTSGVYDLQPDPSNNMTHMTAFCDMGTDGGGWTVFQRRRDGSDDFFRGWNSYKHGFGSYRHDHWLGLENIHLLTKYGDNVMRIELTDWENKTQWAEFSYTRIMDESDGYRILVGGYRGTAGDPFHSLSYSMRMQSMRFSTFDSDSDLDSGGNCALTFTSGWWFNKCFQVNLNGVWYGNSRYAGPSMNGIVWDLWPEHFNGYSLKHTEMKLRPADFLRRSTN